MIMEMGRNMQSMAVSAMTITIITRRSITIRFTVKRETGSATVVRK